MQKQQEANKKRWFVHCDFCSYHRIFEEADFTEIKTSPIPGGSPKLNPETKKAEARPPQTQSKKIKCPKCGRGTTVKKLPDVYSKAFKMIDEESQQRHAEAEREQRVKDGEPIKREKDPSFLG